MTDADILMILMKVSSRPALYWRLVVLYELGYLL